MNYSYLYQQECITETYKNVLTLYSLKASKTEEHIVYIRNGINSYKYLW